jgi:lysophospholipase L1-like esterase
MIEDLYMQWEKLGVQVLDLMSSLVDPTTGHYITQISSGDGVHPDDTGHALMFQSIPLSYFDVARTQKATELLTG